MLVRKGSGAPLPACQPASHSVAPSGPQPPGQLPFLGSRSSHWSIVQALQGPPLLAFGELPVGSH